MPAIRTFPTNPDALEGAAIQDDRSRELKRAWDYYEGHHAKVVTGRNITINLVARAVNQAVSMLAGTAPVVSAGDKKADTRLKAAIARNGAGRFYIEAALQGAITGHVFVRLADIDGKAVWRLVRTERVTAFWQPGTGDVIGYVSHWKDGDADVQQAIWKDDQAPGVWHIRVARRETSLQGWVVETEEKVSYRPMVDWQNLPQPGQTKYGLPDVRKADRQLNDAVNFIASNTGRIIKHHAHPKTIGTGVDAEDVEETTVESFWTIPNPDARVYNLEMQSDLSSSLRFMDTLRESFYAQVRAVDMATLRANVDRLTNFGLRVLFKDALDKMGEKRELYGAGLTDLYRYALSIEDTLPADIEIAWGDVLPYNLLDASRAAQIDVATGIMSKATAAGILHLDWRKEQERMEEEQNAAASFGDRVLKAMAMGGNVGQ